MNYEQYSELQTRIDWLYDFHPGFFEQLSDEQRKSLHDGFLYDVDDEEYPKSIEKYFKDTIVKDDGLQKTILMAVRQLYELSGSGELEIEHIDKT